MNPVIRPWILSLISITFSKLKGRPLYPSAAIRGSFSSPLHFHSTHSCNSALPGRGLPPSFANCRSFFHRPSFQFSRFGSWVIYVILSAYLPESPTVWCFFHDHRVLGIEDFSVPLRVWSVRPLFRTATCFASPRFPTIFAPGLCRTFFVLRIAFLFATHQEFNYQSLLMISLYLVPHATPHTPCDEALAFETL